jgi:hypothetical protein
MYVWMDEWMDFFPLLNQCVVAVLPIKQSAHAEQLGQQKMSTEIEKGDLACWSAIARPAHVNKLAAV